MTGIDFTYNDDTEVNAIHFLRTQHTQTHAIPFADGPDSILRYNNK